MTILHLDAGREMRGGQWQVLRLIEGLNAAGVSSTLLAPPNALLFAAARSLGLRVEPLAWTRLFLLARKHDIVHAHDARSHTMAALAGATPLVVARRVAFPIGSGRASRWKYARARQLVAVSEHVKRILIEGGVPNHKIAVVPDGVPLLPQSTGTRIVTPDDGGDPLKGTPLAVEAARSVGADIEVSHALEEDLRTTGILVYITRNEGLGSAALLAMSAGVAVVASDIGGLREIIRHRVDGMLVENSPAAVGQALRELVGHPELAQRLGQEARRTVSERYTVDRMVRATMEVYRQVLS